MFKIAFRINQVSSEGLNSSADPQDQLMFPHIGTRVGIRGGRSERETDDQVSGCITCGFKVADVAVFF